MGETANNALISLPDMPAERGAAYIYKKANNYYYENVWACVIFPGIAPL